MQPVAARELPTDGLFHHKPCSSPDGTGLRQPLVPDRTARAKAAPRVVTGVAMTTGAIGPQTGGQTLAETRGTALTAGTAGRA